ncbi:P-loop containing nucleoside triphosphate hydrolase protein [Mytilinidion resinicola]|uniref:P-loop containing nucleoside triphosphate hydrolase protein n=1 Tax=Mytilinidion resinicola TaxID=574789 RepID=A0A6A6XZK7_9PEZI|nr:P-loop containing nucleoside triphosphate hydrolase protein [Mytilinidion resinicola]KAF2801840.1 P-loop containing nucleoside triphosphate hydrolase protein [Mytilinidion resinicola]
MLVASFDRGDDVDGFDDVVRGKGQGLIILLHGAPGLGKTMTAGRIIFVVALSTKYRCNPISAYDLARERDDMNDTLQNTFQVAERWGGVLLLDEADSRMSEESDGRSFLDAGHILTISTAFLRHIEFYNGLLFLTTNYKGRFDDAFHSRMHVTIKYPDLSPGSRSNIWCSLLTQSPRKPGIDDSWTDLAYDVLGRLQTNGRQIKNSIMTACRVSKSEKVALGVRHIMQVIQITLPGEQSEQVVRELEKIMAEDAKGKTWLVEHQAKRP